MSKCTLVVDGNWLLRSRIFTCEDKFLAGLDDYTPGRQMIQRLLSQSLVGMVNYLRCLDDVIIVRDGGSWRKKIEKPAAYKTDYKSNRTLNEEVNWDQIWGAFDDWCERCKSIGMTVSNSKNAEGDDWITYWSNRLFNDGRDVIIWSTDKDLWQLVKYRADGTFVACFEKTSGIVFHKKADKSNLSQFDFILEPEDSANMIWLKNNILEIKYIEPTNIIMDKVICGDAGDNVLSIVTQLTTTKTGKTIKRKVTPKDWEECKFALNITYDNFIKQKENIISFLLTKKRYAGYNRCDMSDMFDFNIKMVTLSMDIIPEELFESAEWKSFDIQNIKNNYMLLCKDDDTASLVEKLPF